MKFLLTARPARAVFLIFEPLPGRPFYCKFSRIESAAPAELRGQSRLPKAGRGKNFAIFTSFIVTGPKTDNSEQAEAFLKAYDELGDAIFRHCYFRVYDRERAKELAQECFLRTWDQIARGREINNLKAFLYRVATNLTIDESRRRKEESLESRLEAGFEPAVAPRSAEQAEAARLLAAADRLDPKYREVLIMRYVEGLGPAEIAGIIGETENNVSVRLHRAIERLRQTVL